MKKRLLAALLTGALALSLTACGGGTDSSAADGGDTASTHDGPYKISMVLKTNAAEFWNIVQAGAEAYEDEHPDQVSLDIKGPPAETYYEEQLNTIQTDLAVESYDGYLIAPLQSEAVATAIANTDKPVVAYDTRIDSDKCLATRKQPRRAARPLLKLQRQPAGPISSASRSQAFRVTQPTLPAWKATAKA